MQAAFLGWGLFVAGALFGYFAVSDNQWLVGTTWSTAVRAGADGWALTLFGGLALGNVAVTLAPLGATLLQIWVLGRLLGRIREPGAGALILGALAFAATAFLLSSTTAADTRLLKLLGGAIVVGLLGAWRARLRISQRELAKMRPTLVAESGTDDVYLDPPPVRTGNLLQDWWQVLRYHPAPADPDPSATPTSTTESKAARERSAPVSVEDVADTSTTAALEDDSDDTAAQVASAAEAATEAVPESADFGSRHTRSAVRLGRTTFGIPRWVNDAQQAIQRVFWLVMTVAALWGVVALARAWGPMVAAGAGVKPGFAGGIILVLSQLAYLPTALLWVLSWIAGPGFTLGTGTLHSAFGVAALPVPAIPLLFAVPTTTLGWWPPATLALVGAFSGGWLAHSWRKRYLSERLVAFASAVLVTGATFAVLLWAATGAMGPGRFQAVGPFILATVGWLLMEIFIPALVVLLLGDLWLIARYRAAGKLLLGTMGAGVNKVNTRRSRRKDRRSAAAEDEAGFGAESVDVTEELATISPRLAGDDAAAENSTAAEEATDEEKAKPDRARQRAAAQVGAVPDDAATSEIAIELRNKLIGRQHSGPDAVTDAVPAVPPAPVVPSSPVAPPTPIVPVSPVVPIFPAIETNSEGQARKEQNAQGNDGEQHEH